MASAWAVSLVSVLVDRADQDFPACQEPPVLATSPVARPRVDRADSVVQAVDLAVSAVVDEAVSAVVDEAAVDSVAVARNAPMATRSSATG